MIRSIGMVIVGLGMLFYGGTHYTTPLAANAPERTGWLYQTFGQKGLALGSAAIGLIALAIGIYWCIGVFRALREMRRENRKG